MSKLKLYTEPGIIPKGVEHTFMLIPFLGVYKETQGDPDNGRFLELMEKGIELFELTEDPKGSDYFLLPFGYSFDKEHQSVIGTFLAKAELHGKRTLVFYNADDDTKIPKQNLIVFRTSFKAGTRSKHEHALPGWSIDFKNYMKDGQMNYLSKEERPSISYCGYIDHLHDSLFWKIRRAFSTTASNESRAKAIRGKAVRVLGHNKMIRTDFVIRNGFWAAGITDKLAARREYAENMINSMFAIVTRGGGNFSYRLYEVMSCGRIPLFIDTDCVLPFDDELKWKEHTVWLEERECDKMDEILLSFYKATTNEKLMDIQRKNRSIYENYLSPYGFFKHLQKKLIDRSL